MKTLLEKAREARTKETAKRDREEQERQDQKIKQLKDDLIYDINQMFGKELFSSWREQVKLDAQKRPYLPVDGAAFTFCAPDYTYCRKLIVGRLCDRCGCIFFPPSTNYVYTLENFADAVDALDQYKHTCDDIAQQEYEEKEARLSAEAAANPRSPQKQPTPAERIADALNDMIQEAMREVVE